MLSREEIMDKIFEEGTISHGVDYSPEERQTYDYPGYPAQLSGTLELKIAKDKFYRYYHSLEDAKYDFEEDAYIDELVHPYFKKDGYDIFDSEQVWDYSSKIDFYEEGDYVLLEFFWEA